MTTDDGSAGEHSKSYAITLDRDACEGIFACLVRDDRFVEAADGLAAIDESDAADGESVVGANAAGTVTATFEDGRIDDARAAAAACPLAAIEVTETGGDRQEGSRA